MRSNSREPVRNVFDQYEQLENRVTHALGTALAEDPRLLREFLRKFARCSPPRGARLVVEEQSLPGEPTSRGEDDERGLPDIWIHDGKEWALLIEAKITAQVRVDQLRRHVATAVRRGAREPNLLLITAQKLHQGVPPGVRTAEWSRIYSWLKRSASASEWAARTAEFLEVVEARMAAREESFDGSLTTFSGFPFSESRPYSYGEAKRILRLAMDGLAENRSLRDALGMDPTGARRKAIMGRDALAVWDFLSLKAADPGRSFTAFPHLALAVSAEHVIAQITVPNGLDRRLRRQIRSLSREQFQALLEEIGERLDRVVRRTKGSAPWFVGLQRRYPHQSAMPIVDARLEFDLRTIVATRSRASTPVKQQPGLLDAAYGAFQKRGTNYQMAIGLLLPYRQCRIAGTEKALDVIAAAWIACAPLLREMGLPVRGA